MASAEYDTATRTVRALRAVCEVLECQPGDLLRWEAEDAAGE